MEVGYDVVGTEPECLSLCKTTDGCNWYSFDSARSLCLLTADCAQLEVCGQDECLHGEKGCGDTSGKVDVLSQLMYILTLFSL